MNVMSDARRKRLHRTSAARVLASLESSCTVDDLAQIDWESLDKVPHWCFLERTQSNRLQLVCGCIFLAPMIVQWMDGKRLKQARALVGETYFDAAIRAGCANVTAVQVDAAEDVPELLARAGAAVLLGSVEHTVLRKLLADQFPMQVDAIGEEVARPVYTLALKLIDEVEQNTTPNNPGPTADTPAVQSQQADAGQVA